MMKQLWRMAGILLASAVLGTLLLTLVFCLPVAQMKEHVAVSTDDMIMDESEISEDAFSQYIWKEKETYTDTIMVQNAIEKIEGKNVFEHAMWVYHSDLEEDIWTPEASLQAFCEGDTEQMYLHEYSRYWHGYLIYLKPLLLLFSWKQIVWMGIGVQILLMMAVLIVSLKKKRIGIAITMFAGFLFMKPILVLISLTMSVCWIITLAVVLYMLLYHDRIEEKKAYPEFFLMVGILTSYFDFLTYPVVTLGFPLCAYFLLKKGADLKENIQKVFGYSICWGIGYAGMWAMKWVIADITLHTGTIKDAVWSIIGRTESIGGRPRMNGGFYVIGLNLQEYGWEIYPIAVALLLTAVIAVVIAGSYKLSAKLVLVKLVPFAIIFCIPFAWIIVVQHHSALHARFTFRILSVAVLSICCMIFSLINEVRKSKKQKNNAENALQTGK